jgi:chromosome segregation protein
MRLKRLTLHGFKTFADKTTIEFSEGVTAIVGPNGSGKSNLLDALTWCLGEQKASNLRATRAQDVIFAGSSRRKPMGMAEVSLTVDNEDRFLPLDFAEVTVTRRIYRSGEGEYLINKAPCRLKDITELFLDTGVGRGAYAIVNQSEIDSILSARPEDRRELFEEAAGIKKYRVRKREAQRKLEHAEQNLVRVRDILGELGSGLAPLEAQATTALRFLELSERLRSVEVGLLAWDYKRLQEDLTELGRTSDAATAESETLRAEATRLEASAEDLGRQIVETEGEMDQARLLQQTAMAESERNEGRIALGAERRAGALRAIETLEHDLTALADERVRLEAEGAAAAEAARLALERVAELSGEMTQAEAVVGETDRALNELTRLVRGQEADYLELARRLAAQKAELVAVRARIAQRGADVAETSARARARFAEAEAAGDETATLGERAEAARQAIEAARQLLAEDREPARAEAADRVAALADDRAKTERRTAEQGARLRALEETEAAQEGYYVGVKSVTRAVSSGRLRGRYVVVADALRVPADLDTAIEIALGGSLQDVITDTQAEAKTAIAFLNETRGGRATFLPLDALREQEVPDALRRAARQYSGVRGSAADLVGCDVDLMPAIRVLLARVLIVDDLDTATRTSRQLGRGEWGKIVTLSGEVVVPSGAITGGTQGRPGPNLLGRKREIAELTDAVAAGRRAIDTVREQEADAKAAAEAARLAVREAEAAVAAAREAAADAGRRHQARAADADRMAREAAALQGRADSLRDSGAADAAREQALDAALVASDAQDEGALATREELQKRQAALAVRRGEAQVAARAQGNELSSLRERARSLQRDADRAREGSVRATLTADERTRRADEAREIVAREEAQAEERVVERTRVRATLAEAGALLEKWRIARQSLLNENFQLTERIKGALRGAQVAGEQAQAARLRAARVEAQAETIGQRLLDEYELHPDSAVALTGGAQPDRDTSQEISRLRRDIKALGPVNTAAIEEYERQSERWRFLTEQKQDLEEARDRLNAAISEIDDSTRGVFLATYQAVGVAFARLFSRLFGGGTTELVLTDPDDILETGIEIVAQPPGKKRQNLALLSGGERALTATALLFAFLEVRPAPFCVLDEVDAPLDGANVEKFSDLLRDFGTGSQFIVITHNATTMEAAPLWFGITMQEPGISRGISMKVPESAPAEPEVDPRPGLDAGETHPL